VREAHCPRRPFIEECVAHIARLLSQRNAIDDTIAAVIRRPMTGGISANGSRPRC